MESLSTRVRPRSHRQPHCYTNNVARPRLHRLVADPRIRLDEPLNGGPDDQYRLPTRTCSIHLADGQEQSPDQRGRRQRTVGEESKIDACAKGGHRETLGEGTREPPQRGGLRLHSWNDERSRQGASGTEGLHRRVRRSRPRRARVLASPPWHTGTHRRSVECDQPTSWVLQDGAESSPGGCGH